MAVGDYYRVRLQLKDGTWRTVALWNDVQNKYTADENARVPGLTTYQNLKALVDAQNSRTQKQYNAWCNVKIEVNPTTEGEQFVDASDVVDVALVDVE
jgi:hypothetical protein